MGTLTSIRIQVILFIAAALVLIAPRDASAQTVTRLTFNTGTDFAPAWDPRGGTIAYVREKAPSSNVFDAYAVSSSGQGGEQPYLTGLNSPFGVAVNLSWIGTSGFLGVEEAINGFEVLRFDTAQAPFDRTVLDNSDAANTRLLAINGGGGGGIMRFSRDGNTALIRISTSGSGGAMTIRSGAVSSMVAQASTAFGTILISESLGSDPKYLNGASLSPDGTQYVLSSPASTSTTPHDLVLGATAAGTLPINLTNTSGSGLFNVQPDFSPDGTKIVFARRGPNTTDPYDLYTINTDATGLTQLTNTPNFSESYPSWSPDGGSIAFAGVHVAGFESSAPALEAGESANLNVYILTLTPTNTVTPKTKIVDPPIVTIDGNNVTFTLAPFLKAQKTAVAGRAKKPKAKFSFRYNLVVAKVDGKKKDTINKTSKKNILTIKNVPPGSYTAKYRVEVLKKVGSKTTVAGRTSFSPSASFTIPAV